MFIALHNTFSSKQIEEFTKTVFGMGIDSVIFTRATGSAAQNGIPIAQKMAIKSNKNLMFLEDIDDAIEILNPERVILITESGIASEKIDFKSIGERDLIIFSGNSSGFSKKELEKGKGMHILENNIGAIGEVAIFLYKMNE
uniref:SpoU rRNA methylase family enzyme n=1 Tax=Methanococcus maripaludis (strain C6 / ATCC BAA-1332) TaxID=444158 RepID=A9A8T1_METM6